jgi:hypothetical protein
LQDKEEDELGEPIRELAQHPQELFIDLVPRTRRTIQRRVILGEFTFFATMMPLVVLREFWEVVVQDCHAKGNFHAGVAS